jgi:hypothetical protein
MFGVAAALLVGGGTLTRLTGKLHYSNYWGGNVFAPFAIVVGLILLFMAILGPGLKTYRTREAPPPPWKRRRHF